MDGGPDSIDVALARDLVAEQFPEFGDLPITAVQPGGWDNRTFRLGTELAVRLPSAARYAPQIDREALVFAELARQLPTTIPIRVGSGQPCANFPFPWAINRWLPGTPFRGDQVSDDRDFANECGNFLARLHNFVPSIELSPGEANFYRGGALAAYAPEVEEAMSRLEDAGLRHSLETVWCNALGTAPQTDAWVHGDFLPWNILGNRQGNICGVIDWGLAAVGDPACDLAIAWTIFGRDARKAFRSALKPDDSVWVRGCGWSLWKAVTLATGVNTGPPDDIAQSRAVLERICSEHDC